MGKSVGIEYENSEQLSGIVKDLVHEIGNPLNVLEGNYNLYIENKDSDDIGKEMRDLGDFIDEALEVRNRAELSSRIDERSVESMLDYAGNSLDYDEIVENLGLLSHEELEEYVQRIAGVTKDTYAYQRRLEDRPISDSIKVEEVMKPLEEKFEGLSSRDEEITSKFRYNGLEDATLVGDSGFRLIAWTIAKNWEEHAYNGQNEIDLGFEVEDAGFFYEIDVWDTGQGLYNEFSGEDKGSEMRYRGADDLFSSDSEVSSGHGLSMAKDVAELYSSEIFYSEEMLEEEGFGLKIKVPKY